MMIENGAIEEVEKLLSKNIADEMPVMKAIGVPELKRYLKGEISKSKAVSEAKLRTRQYAKRQLTWFRNRFRKIDCEQIVF